MSILVSVKNLEKKYNHTPLYNKLTMEIPEGKITSIVGPNGSGKSTLLHILAGIVPKDGGHWSVANFKHSEFSYIFQNYRDSLLPWRTNYENVAFPLQIQKKSKKFIDSRIKELQNTFQLVFNWGGYPYELSGGQQQMLAFMRSLITYPKILFIDEPFSALDYENNLKLRKHLHAYFLKYKPTIVLITHNIEEAVHLSHHILVLSTKPTSVVESIDIPLPFPRTIETLKTVQFHQIKSTVLDAFQKTSIL